MAALPPPLITSFAPTPHPLLHSAWSCLVLVTPTSDHALPAALSRRLRSLQLLLMSLGSLEGLCTAIQGLRKGCHSSHHAA